MRRLIGALLGDVGHPQPVWCWWSKVALDQVGCWDGLGVAAGQPGPPPPMAALEASGPQQPGDPFAAHLDVQAQAQLGVHARAPSVPRLRAWIWRDLLGERSVGQRAGRGGT
jgi:hypothetical protein